MEYRIDPASAPVTRVALLAALVDGDLDTAYRMATGLLDEGVPFDSLVGEVLAPVQREVGSRWAGGDLSVADEHAATASVEALVALLAAGLQPATGPLVVVACPEGDAHSLPARVVAAVLALHDFRTVLLGASLPAPDLDDYLERQAPFALALSVSMPATLYRAAESIAVAHTRRVPVVLGGRAIGDGSIAARLGADGHAATATAAADLLDRWRDALPATPAGGAPPHPECAALERHRYALLAAAFPPDAPELPGRVRDEFVRIIDIAQGALLLGEPGLVADHLAFLYELGSEPDHVAPAIDAARERLVASASGPLPATAAVVGMP
jgi:methanogenic corrinoid protein MtbC1